jgi:hypothetical protein
MGLLSAETPVFAPVPSIVSAVLASVTSTANAAPDNYGGTGNGGGALHRPTAEDIGSANSACRPANHQLLLENDRVRVLLTTIPRGATTPIHTHRWPSVEYVPSTTNSSAATPIKTSFSTRAPPMARRTYPTSSRNAIVARLARFGGAAPLSLGERKRPRPAA